MGNKTGGSSNTPRTGTSTGTTPRSNNLNQQTKTHIGNMVINQNKNQSNQQVNEYVRKSTDIRLNNKGAVFFSQNDNSANEVVKTEEPKERVELFFSLIDTNSNSNTVYAVAVGIHSKNMKGINSIGKTLSKQGGEAKIDFDKTFIIDYYFEMKQTLSVTILINERQVEQIETTVGKIMGSKGQIFRQEFNIQGFTGKLNIYGVPVKTDDTDLKLNISALFGNNSYTPYYIVKRNSGIGNTINWINAYKSEVLDKYPNQFKFNVVNLSTQFLCNSDMKKPLLIEFFDFNTHQLIGGYCATVEAIGSTSGNVLLSDPHGSVLQDRQVQMNNKLSKKYKFLDYIRGGVQISMIVGIDFTGSNGDPRKKDSLHSIERRPNLYEKAIDSCCSIVAYYDADQLFPVFGYGAVLKHEKTVNHCFPLNLSNDPNIYTVGGILNCYRNFLNDVKLYGPTYFGPLIKECNKFARDATQTENYVILMILTDGMINDMQETVDAIVEASFLPMSIIIIGIGPGGDDGFSEMDFLDGDDEPLVDSNNKKCARDIVQFVEFNKFNNDPILLAEKVLEEVPRQLEDYYKMIEKPPGDPIIF